MAEKPTERPQAAGLKWRGRASGIAVPYWFASTAAIKAGYPVKSANLNGFVNDPPRLIEHAMRLQTEMVRWLSDAAPRELVFDGRFGPVFDLYETDPESTYKVLPGHTARVYGIYLKKLRAHISDRRVDRCDGRDVKKWFAEWRGTNDGEDHLPRARMVLSVLKAAIAFGVICRVPGCADFQTILRGLEFEAPESRSFAPTSDQVIAARQAAHAVGAHERALVYSLQHQTTLRQWDIVGQWLPMSDPRPSAVHARGKKWIGLDWKMLQNDMILARVKPSKTAKTTAVDISFDLAVCPMVVEDLAYFPIAERVGPMIVNPRTKMPYTEQTFREAGWRPDFLTAGIPLDVWNRDLRAGGVTESRKAGATKDDVRKLAGHAKETTTDVYDRDDVEAHRRVMTLRNARDKNIA
jgi:hypothetical protein